MKLISFLFQTFLKGIMRIVDLVDATENEEGVPNSSRIIHDCNQVFDAMQIVFQNDGKLLVDWQIETVIVIWQLAEIRQAGGACALKTC